MLEECVITFLDNLKTEHSDPTLRVSRQHPSALIASVLRRRVARSPRVSSHLFCLPSPGSTPERPPEFLGCGNDLAGEAIPFRNPDDIFRLLELKVGSWIFAGGVPSVALDA